MKDIKTKGCFVGTVKSLNSYTLFMNTKVYVKQTLLLVFIFKRL